MSSIVIQADRVSKQYRLGTLGGKRLVDDVNRWWARLRGREDPLSKVGAPSRPHAKKAPRLDSPEAPHAESIYALREVSFEVKQGEVLGIIGRNGAGKSTLLKILSRVTAPSSGEIRVKGRIASLLEVGTGFHPELTGRENTFLNGAILGMTKPEIRKKFDEIVAFSEIEKFIDTPVKRYSSGMYVRLAFAVAAHLDPEILIVDEVLAVGDAEFQKKCLGKMGEVAKGGRTVIFVSHNMTAVNNLTERVVLLNKGQVQLSGPTAEGVLLYLGGAPRDNGIYQSQKTEASVPFVSQVSIHSKSGNADHISGSEMQIKFEIRHHKPLKNACFSFQIVNQFQQPVLHCSINDVEQPICRQAESAKLTCVLPRLALNVGKYTITTYLSEPPGGAVFEVLENICEFKVVVLGKQALFGWRPNVCAYIEHYEWNVS